MFTACAALLFPACSLDLDRGEEAAISRNECTQNSDCGPGECWQGACVARDSQLSSVLLEVAPPKGAAGENIGGLRFLQNLPGLLRSSSDTVVDLLPATEVVGALLAQPKACGSAARSFPVEVTFTPREDSYGLPVVTYAAKTQRVGVNQRECAPKIEGLTEIDLFTVRVPAGSYDVYVKPLPDAENPDCVVAPQLIRGQSFENAAQTCFPIAWAQPRKLPVGIPWRVEWTGEESLDGWKIDVVHPLTGHILSAPTLLTEEDRAATAVGVGYRREVFYSPVPTDEAVKELVRLTPPPGVAAPVVQADRAGLQVTSEEATFPNMTPFLPPVEIIGSAVPLDDPAAQIPDGGITGRAIFTATKLDGIRAGVFASYATSVVVGKGGELSAQLLPGDYRLRVVPDIGTGFGATESPVRVQCQRESTGVVRDCVSRAAGLPRQVQEGKSFLVKPAATLKGGVVDSSTGERVGQISVDAVPASVGTRACAQDPSSVACAVVGVLDIALGDAAFVPRTVSGIAQAGSFTLEGLDCGECKAESGALFDVLVKPPEESRRAWGLSAGNKVSAGEKDIGDIELPLPVIHQGTVESREVGVPVPVKRALLRAYVLRDETGARITDATGMKSCSAVVASGAAVPATHCIRSAVQVGQTSTDDLGRFELVLPSRIKEIE
jgi:hypothetical protein